MAELAVLPRALVLDSRMPLAYVPSVGHLPASRAC